MMFTYLCMNCNSYWASQAAPDQYAIITKICPECVRRTLPFISRNHMKMLDAQAEEAHTR
jgi:hypothetical protein